MLEAITCPPFIATAKGGEAEATKDGNAVPLPMAPTEVRCLRIRCVCLDVHYSNRKWEDNFTCSIPPQQKKAHSKHFCQPPFATFMCVALVEVQSAVWHSLRESA